jgi:hypothetical protein
MTFVIVIPGRELCVKLTKSILSLSERTRNPETVHGAGFRVCAQEGASRNDGVSAAIHRLNVTPEFRYKRSAR